MPKIPLQPDPSIVYILEGKKIIERFIGNSSEATSNENTSNNNNNASYYIVAATPQEEYRQLKYMEGVRENECIQLYEANKLEQARAVDDRLDLIRSRMKEVETLCRYTQSLYSDVLAAHQTTFYPETNYDDDNNDNTDKDYYEDCTNSNGNTSLLSSPTIAVGGGIQAARKNKELANARKHEEMQKEGIGNVLSNTASAFHFDDKAARESGYALVFCCERNHSHHHHDLQSNNNNNAFTNIKNLKSNSTNKAVTWKSATQLFHEIQDERLMKEEKEKKQNDKKDENNNNNSVTSSSSNNKRASFSSSDANRKDSYNIQSRNEVHLAAKSLKAPSMTEFLNFQISEIAREDRLAEEQREREELEEQRRQIQEEMGTTSLSSPTTATTSNKKQNHHEKNNRVQHEILASTRGNQSERQSYQVSFSCDGRIDENTYSSESKRLSSRLQTTIDESLERLPLAKWGAENRMKKVEVAMMSTLDSLFGVIVGKNKDDAELFFRQLRKSETIGSQLSGAKRQQRRQSVLDHNDDDDNTTRGGRGHHHQVRSQIDDELLFQEEDGNNDENEDDHEQTLKFTQLSKKRKAVGKFTRIMARRIPAGGSRACSEILHQLAGGGQGSKEEETRRLFHNRTEEPSAASKITTNTNNTKPKKNHLDDESDDDDDNKNDESTKMFSGHSKKYLKMTSNSNKQSAVDKYLTQATEDQAWWMKTTTTPSVELSGLADALQKVVSTCTPFVPQHAMDTIIRGGTVTGALDSQDDLRAASLCMLIDGDCGFDFTMKDVKKATLMFAKVVENYYGEVVQTFGDYAVAVFWTRPVGYVIDEHEDDDETMSALPKGVPLYRLSPSTRAVLAAMELFKQVRRSCCGVSVAKPPLTEEQKSKMLPYKTRNVDIVKLIRKGAFSTDDGTSYDDGQTITNSSNNNNNNNDNNQDGEESQHNSENNNSNNDVKQHDPAAPKHSSSSSSSNKNKLLNYNIKAHVDPNVRCSGDAVEECVELALLSEKHMRRPIVISSYAAEDCDSAVARLQRFSHNLIEYFSPTIYENLRLEEPPAERLVGKYHYDSSFDQQYKNDYNNNANNSNNNDENDDYDPTVDLSKSVATGFQVIRAKNKGKINFHSIHSEPTLRRLFKNLEPYRNCGYILRSSLKEVLYPLCFPDPIRSQAGGSLESELVAQARARFEEYEKNKYDAALAQELGDAASELSPMEAMRLMLLKARKDQRKQQKARAEAGSHGDKKSLSEQLRDQTRLADKLISNERAKNKAQQELALVDAGPQGPKKSLFNVEKATAGGFVGNRNSYEVQSDIHPDVLMMYKEIFGTDMTGITHDVLDTMLTPLRDNAAKEHVTFPEFCLFAARLQAE